MDLLHRIPRCVAVLGDVLHYKKVRWATVSNVQATHQVSTGQGIVQPVHSTPVQGQTGFYTEQPRIVAPPPDYTPGQASPQYKM